MDFSSYLAAYREIASLGFPSVLFLALLGSYYDLWRWGKTCRVTEAKLEAALAAIELRSKADLTELKLSCSARDASQQKRIDELFDRMIEAAGLIEKSARRVSR